MRCGLRPASIIAALAWLALALPADAASGPDLREPTADLRGALECSLSLRTAERRPVLLIHGTGTGAEANWRDGFATAFEVQGRATCLVHLPANGLVDLQRSSEYVVFALRSMHRKAHSRVDVVGHSQGGLQPVWALRFWPDLRRKVSNVVALGTPYQGITGGALACSASLCPEAFWQFGPESEFLKTLNSKDPTRKRVDYTSIYTDFDEVGNPASQRDRLSGASLVGVQQVCPSRPVDHFLLADDAATFAIATYALDHAGPFRADDVDPGNACTSLMPPGVDPLARAPKAALLPLALAEALLTAPLADREPPLRCYARRPCRRAR